MQKFAATLGTTCVEQLVPQLVNCRAVLVQVDRLALPVGMWLASGWQFDRLAACTGLGVWFRLAACTGLGVWFRLATCTGLGVWFRLAACTGLGVWFRLAACTGLGMWLAI